MLHGLKAGLRCLGSAFGFRPKLGASSKDVSSSATAGPGLRCAVPKTLALEVANVCNARCIFCPIFHGSDTVDRKKRPATFMADALFKRCVDQLSTWPVLPDNIFLNMFGEPCLDKNLAGKIRYLAEKGYAGRIGIQTNAQFLEPELARVFCECNVGYIRPSLDSGVPEIFEQLRVGCDFETVYGNIARLAKIRNEINSSTIIQVQHVRTSLNVNDTKQLYGLLLPHMRTGDSLFVTTSLSWNSPEFAESNHILRRAGETLVKTQCEILNDYLIVLADGLIAPCCFDYNLSVADGSLGSALDESLLEIYNGSKRMNLIRAISKGGEHGMPIACRKCSLLFSPKECRIKPMDVSQEALVEAESGFSMPF